MQDENSPEARSADTVGIVSALRASTMLANANPQLTLGANIVGLLRRPWLRATTASALLIVAIAACNQREPAIIDDPEGEIPPKEAQSDFIDIGKQAGIEWLSFVPNAEREYPSLYQGLDRDQRRRLKLAPKEQPNNRVLLHFDLPANATIWPVQWYETDLMAVSTPEAEGISVAVARLDVEKYKAKSSYAFDVCGDIQRLRYGRILLEGSNGENGSGSGSSSGGATWGLSFFGPDPGQPSDDTCAVVDPQFTSVATPTYGVRILATHEGRFLVVAEIARKNSRGEWQTVARKSALELQRVLKGITIKRELGVEGLPTHKCSSSIEDLRTGLVAFPEGAVHFPVTDGRTIRKVGGDSTVQIDGHGAKPWILIRRLAATTAAGDLRVRVRGDPTFQRRLDNPGASFSAGYAPEGSIPAVFWDYRDAGAEQVTVGILKVGDELLTFEIISTGLRDGEARRKARQAALDLLAGATAEPSKEAPEFQPLIGWNVGTMGRGG